MWLSTDPLQEKYPNISTYAYTALNPVKYVDPDGRKVIPVDYEAQRNIINTLTKDEAKFVKFDRDGSIRADKLNKSKSKSENFTALKALVNSEQTYKFAVVDIDPNGQVFTSESVGNENYYYGLTAVPDPEEYGTKSPDGDVWIYTSSFLGVEKQATNTAHEGYGHTYFYELKKQGSDVDPWHRFSKTFEQEWDEEFQMELEIPVFSKSNHKLENHIEVVTNQAKVNYESRQKK